MNKLFFIIMLMVAVSSCCSTNKITSKMDMQENQKSNSKLTEDTIPKVTGIGGIFFLSEQPKEAKEWYAKNLGFEINNWGGVSFESRDLQQPEEINSLQWSLFKKDSDYFAPSKKEFMINYRVQNMVGLVQKLKENGVTILDEITEYDFGKFVHIMDNAGNKIELWEPANKDKKDDQKAK